LRWFRKQAPRKERNLVPPPKTDCVAKRDEKYGQCKTKRSQLIESNMRVRSPKIVSKAAQIFSARPNRWEAAAPILCYVMTADPPV
jgi:hypothetical protein